MEKITGKFTYIIYHNQENGYIVASFKAQKPYSNITVTGTLFDINMQIEYALEGEFKHHTKYGEQFNFSKYEKIIVSDEEGIISFLSSSAFKGIGTKTASSIVAHLGVDTLTILKDDPTILKQFGFKDKVIDAIKAGIEDIEDISQDIIKLKELGIHNQIIRVAKHKFKNEYLEYLLNQPYFCARMLKGYSVKMADFYVANTQMEVDEFSRSCSLFYEYLRKECFNSGHVYLLLEQLNVDENIIKQLMREKLITIEQNRIYLAPLYDSETYISQFLSYFVAEENVNFDLNAAIRHQETIFNIEYDMIQKEAIEAFFENNFLMITGGPGTGKTTITRSMIDIYKKQFPHKNIAICAPTGRAAKRIGELCDVMATTIHRILKWDLETEEFSINQNNPLDIDLLIVDEFSMVDLYLFACLLKGCINVSKIVLIGDKNQLPSISSGTVLQDLLNFKPLTRIELNVNHRQIDLSGIIELAQDINNQNELKQHYPNVSFYEEDVLQQLVLDLNTKLSNHNFDFQVLSSMYRGMLGIDNLNLFLQNLLNPASKEKKELKIGQRIYRKYDRILQLKNMVEDNVFNGDIGILADIDLVNKEIAVDFDGNMVIYNQNNFDCITHGYCVSIHKAQGSEYSNVYLFLPHEHRYMFDKKLIYTAVTRAKNEIIIFGNSKEIEYYIKQPQRIIRNSTLLEHLQQLWLDEE